MKFTTNVLGFYEDKSKKQMLDLREKRFTKHNNEIDQLTTVENIMVMLENIDRKENLEMVTEFLLRLNRNADKIQYAVNRIELPLKIGGEFEIN